jgi:hypothetical protein
VEVVPEPVTGGLLAVGLAFFSFVPLRRRST